MSFALVLAPPRMPSSAHLLHSNRRKHMSASPSPSRTPPATAHGQTTPQQATRPGVITLSKPLQAYSHNDRSHRREPKSKGADKDASASQPSTPGPNNADEPSSKDEKRRKGRHNRTRSAANTPAAANSATPNDRPTSPSTSPTRRPVLPHLPTEPPSPTQVRHKKGPHKRAKSAAPSRGSQAHTPNNAGASSAPEDDSLASSVKAPELLAATAQEQGTPAAGSAPIHTVQSHSDARSTTPPPHISDNANPSTPAPSAPVSIPSSAVSQNNSRKGRNLRNSMITVPAGVSLTSGNVTPAKGNKTGSMRIPRTKSQPFSHIESQLSRSVPASQPMMMHTSGSSPLINVTPARDTRPPRQYNSEYRHKPALSLAFPPAPMASFPGAASMPSTPLPRQDSTSFGQHTRGATYPAGPIFPISMAELEESFMYSSSLDESDNSAPDGDELEEQIVFFGQRGSPDLERVDRELGVEQAKREKQETKIKLAGKQDHKRNENRRREKQEKHLERAEAKEAKAIKKVVYAGPQFYNSPAPDALPPPTF